MYSDKKFGLPKDLIEIVKMTIDEAKRNPKGQYTSDPNLPKSDRPTNKDRKMYDSMKSKMQPPAATSSSPTTTPVKTITTTTPGVSSLGVAPSNVQTPGKPSTPVPSKAVPKSTTTPGMQSIGVAKPSSTFSPGKSSTPIPSQAVPKTQSPGILSRVTGVLSKLGTKGKIAAGIATGAAGLAAATMGRKDNKPETQTFDDGSTLTTGKDGKTSSTPRTDDTEEKMKKLEKEMPNLGRSREEPTSTETPSTKRPSVSSAPKPKRAKPSIERTPDLDAPTGPAGISKRDGAEMGLSFEDGGKKKKKMHESTSRLIAAASRALTKPKATQVKPKGTEIKLYKSKDVDDFKGVIDGGKLHGQTIPNSQIQSRVSPTTGATAATTAVVGGYTASKGKSTTPDASSAPAASSAPPENVSKKERFTFLPGSNQMIPVGGGPPVSAGTTNKDFGDMLYPEYERDPKDSSGTSFIGKGFPRDRNPKIEYEDGGPKKKVKMKESALINAFLSLQEKKHHKKKLDPVGKEDEDIDNDGDSDSTDKYLMNRRKAISKNIKEEEIVEASERLSYHRKMVKELQKELEDDPRNKHLLEKLSYHKKMVTKLTEGVEFSDTELEHIEKVLEAVSDKDEQKITGKEGSSRSKGPIVPNRDLTD